MKVFPRMVWCEVYHVCVLVRHHLATRATERSKGLYLWSKVKERHMDTRVQWSQSMCRMFYGPSLLVTMFWSNFFLPLTNDQKITNTCHDHERKQNELNGTIVISWKATTWTTKIDNVNFFISCKLSHVKVT
jgi:hypothetical protein